MIYELSIILEITTASIIYFSFYYISIMIVGMY